MKVIVQPGEGIAPLVKAIEGARKSVRIVIFRFDEAAVERALVAAVKRGVFVHALIAFKNRGGESVLRKLEMRFLANGITVARTADDLVRYHGKMMIVDDRDLYLLAFNFTHLDIERSRSFGVITNERELVREAIKLFDCDALRRRYSAGCPRFLVSPVNARESLSAFIKGAKKTLFIYDVRISDPAMIKVLEERVRAGVKVRIIGQLAAKKTPLNSRRLGRMRLHTRAILRDGRHAFLGSQSMRKLELNSRREIGIIFRNPKVVATIARVFEDDWSHSKGGKGAAKSVRHVPVKKTAKKVARLVEKHVQRRLPVAPMVAQVVNVMQQEANLKLDDKEVKETVHGAVKDALQDAVKEAAKKVVKSMVEQGVGVDQD